MKRPFAQISLTRLIFGVRTIGLVTVALAAAAGVLTGAELYLALQAAAQLLTHGIVFFWAVVLGLIGLVLDVAAAAIAVVGGAVMCLGRLSGRRLVIAAMAIGIAGESVLAFVDKGQYTTTTSVIWIGLLVAGYVLLIVCAFMQRRS